jgi:hypothetical protein
MSKTSKAVEKARAALEEAERKELAANRAKEARREAKRLADREERIRLAEERQNAEFREKLVGKTIVDARIDATFQPAAFVVTLDDGTIVSFSGAGGDETTSTDATYDRVKEPELPSDERIEEIQRRAVADARRTGGAAIAEKTIPSDLTGVEAELYAEAFIGAFELE